MKKVVIGLSVLILILFVFFIMNQRNGKEIFSATPPENGIIFQSSGMHSPWYAYVVDFDSLTLAKYELNDKSLRAEKKYKKINQDKANQIKKLAEKAVVEGKYNDFQLADVNFTLDLSADGKVSSTDTYGPLPDNGAITDLFNLLD